MTVDKLKAFIKSVEDQHDNVRAARATIAALRKHNETLLDQGAELGLGARAVNAMLPKIVRWSDDADVAPVNNSDSDPAQGTQP